MSPYMYSMVYMYVYCIEVSESLYVCVVCIVSE